MNNTLAKVTTKLRNIAGMPGLKLQANAPEILFGIGLGLIGVGVVEACKATLSLEDELDAFEADVYDIKEDEEMFETPKEYKTVLTKTYVFGAMRIAKLYVKSAILLCTGAGCLIKGKNILQTRNLELALLANAIGDDFNLYRSRVVSELGDDADKRFKYGVKKEDEIETVYVDEDGKEHKKKVKKAEVIEGDIPGYSPYCKFFDEGCEAWSPSCEYNLTFLRAQQENANDLLHSRGYLFLTEVYRMLGIPDTMAAHNVGWIMGNGDDEVDFGIYKIHRSANRDFVNGWEPVILLDFNVDGPILEKLTDLGIAAI